MKQRAVVLVADYVTKVGKGRVVKVKVVEADDYVIGIEDVRDARTHLVRTPRDLEYWLESFKQGRCGPATFGICGVCDRIHQDRDVDGEIFTNCIGCAAELVEVYAALPGQGEAE